MIKAAFITQHSSWPWRRQLPRGSSAFGGVEYFAPIDEAEIVFVYDALPGHELVLPRGVAAVFVASEPENVKRYHPAFLDQFDVVITSDRKTTHVDKIYSHAGLPWHVGAMATGGNLLADPMQFEELAARKPRKTKLVSVVSSDKAFTPEHRARLEFVSRLKSAMGDAIDVYGRGIVDFADKADVLDSYRYHVALENCSIDDYWTEKLSDPFLASTYPIYYGCPNIFKYFPERALTCIDINKPDEAIEIIKAVVNSDTAELRSVELEEARRLVMWKHNVFALLAGVANERPDLLSLNRVRSKGIIRIRSETSFLGGSNGLPVQLREFIAAIPYARKAVKAIKRRLR